MRFSDSVVLPPAMSACAMARSWAAGCLAPFDLDAQVGEDIVLCIDELVANVVVHTTSSPVLTVTIDETIRIEVADASGSAAALRDPADTRPGGWGLRIVESVADRWGSAANTTGGKVVWFTVDRRR